MKREDNGQDGQLPWEDHDEFRKLMDSLSQEELRGMLERLNADITANPDDTTALSARGLVHRELRGPFEGGRVLIAGIGKRWPDRPAWDRRAEEDFGRVVDLSPGNAEAHHYRGLARAQLGKRSLVRKAQPSQFWTTTSPSSSTQVTRYRITTGGGP